MKTLKERADFLLQKLTGQKEKSIPINTSAKVARLLELVNLDDVGFRADQVGPYALVPFPFGENKNQVLVVRDSDRPEDRAQISAMVDELKLDHKYQGVEFEGVEPRQFLAEVVTRGLYRGFHDEMGFSVMRFTGLLDISGKPNTKKIDRVLKKAGFQNIGSGN